MLVKRMGNIKPIVDSVLLMFREPVLNLPVHNLGVDVFFHVLFLNREVRNFHFVS